MAKLLVSVRSASEAQAAFEAGAAIIDVKEPDRGPLGRADVRVWREVRETLPAHVPVSVALGELRDWDNDTRSAPSEFPGIAFRKLGLSRAGADWEFRWERLRRWVPGGPAWVAVAYADWERAGAPHPDAVLDAALALDPETCAGLLVDTWDKSSPSPVDRAWGDWFARARLHGRFTALAGGLNLDVIARLASSSLQPDILAVRGAACLGGDRRAAVDPARVAALVDATARVGSHVREGSVL